ETRGAEGEERRPEEAGGSKTSPGAATGDEAHPPAKSNNPPAAKPPPPSHPAVPSPPIAIAKITLQGGNVNFTDHFNKPNYSANLTEIGGSVIGLSSQMNTTPHVDIRGRFAKTAPVAVHGKNKTPPPQARIHHD